MRKFGLIFVLTLSSFLLFGAQDSVQEKVDYLLLKEKYQKLDVDVNELKNIVLEVNKEVAILRTENQGLKDRLDDQNEWIGIWTAIFLGIMAAAGVITILVGRNQAKKVANNELKDIQSTKLSAELELQKISGVGAELQTKIKQTASELKDLQDEIGKLTKSKDELIVQVNKIKNDIKEGNSGGSSG